MRYAWYSVLAWFTLAGSLPVLAGDWPMWRHDASRSATTDETLADKLYPQWTIKLPALTPAWPDQEKLWFDLNYEPVVADGKMLVGSSQSDSVVAFDVKTGLPLWTFLAEGPIRFAPMVDGPRAYVVSDDGYLYCLQLDNGEVLWKFRGATGERKLLGNERLISTWPARGAPVVVDDTLYFAAGIWPFMGIFIHALDAETGVVLWTNDGDGSMYIKQPHHTDSFAGVAPQGHMVVAGDYLLIPGGRSVPAVYDRHTGRMIHYRLSDNNKKGAGSAVSAWNQLYFSGREAFRLDTGDLAEGFSGFPAVSDGRAFAGDESKIRGYQFGDPLWSEHDAKDRRGRPIRVSKLEVETRWTVSADEPRDCILTGRHVVWCEDDRVVAYELSKDGFPEGDDPAWEMEVEGTPARLLAASERLFVVTLEGHIHCLGSKKQTPTRWEPDLAFPKVADDAREQAIAMLDAAGTRAGYGIVWGTGNGQLLPALISESEQHWIAVEPRRDQAHARRGELAGVYGQRVHVLNAAPDTLEIAPYLASVMVCDDPQLAGLSLDTESVKRWYELLRPYGGTAVLRLSAEQQKQLAQAAKELSGAVIRTEGSYTLLVRSGPLEGSGNWTHEHADANNTRVSRDRLVKLPLGILWFGGPTHKTILPRHGHGPQPQVIDGRVIIEGPDLLRATDAYTGRLLWERPWHEFGKLYDNTSHHPGANGTGGNFVSLSDGIYAIHGPECLRLNPDNGDLMHTFRAEFPDIGDEPATFTYINAIDDYLIAGFDLPNTEMDKRSYDDYIASERLAVFNRHTGKCLWWVDAEHEFRNNAICLGGGQLYAIDLLSKAHLDQLKRRGVKDPADSTLHVFDLATGSPVWSTSEKVFGTWLSYSVEYDVLVESGRPGRDVLKDEPPGMRAYAAANGKVLWHDKNYRGPAILHGKQILADREACDLLTGERVMRQDPLTQREVPWTWTRNYGCNTPQACQNLMLFRSGAAGFYDLAGDGGTGNFGGFKTSCTNNLIAAAGLVNVPEYTRTCVCDYQNQSSLALVHMPDVEVWTQFPVASEPTEIRRLSLNLGAPGSRRDSNGQLWLHQLYPTVILVGPPEGPYCQHSSRLPDAPLSWVASSGYRGIQRARIDLGHQKPQTCTVRLHFCDPDNTESGKRVFDIVMQGKTVYKNFDIAALAGGSYRPIVQTFSGIEIDGGKALMIEFIPATESSDLTCLPLVNGIEVAVE